MKLTLAQQIEGTILILRSGVGDQPCKCGSLRRDHNKFSGFNKLDPYKCIKFVHRNSRNTNTKKGRQNAKTRT